MLKIRLQRVGRVHEPVFRLVLTDSKNSTKSGRSLEILGNFDARRGEKAEFKADKIQYWISKGAQPTGTVHNLLISKKIIEGKKVNVLPLKKAILKEVKDEPAPAPKAEAPAAAAEVTPVEEAPAEVTEAPVEETPVAEVVEEAAVAPEAPAEEKKDTPEVA